MTREAIIADVKKKYANADEATIDAVLRTLQETKFGWRLPEQASAVDTAAQQIARSSKPQLKFIGENLAPEEYRKLSFEERGDLKLQLKEQNRKWLEEKFASLQAAWIMVLDGEVIAFDDSLDSYPQIEEIREISSRHGKRPFIFINDLFIAIEESSLDWHSTVYRNDFYPTVASTLRTPTESTALAADFDTGASSSFVDRDLLIAHHIVEMDEEREPDASRHLGQTFKYLRQPFDVEVILPTGEVLSRKMSINCVTGGRNSPFVQINPHRTVLAGRDLFLKLQPRILLDFANRRTRLVAPEQA
ncbi:MAG: hypothetical protein ONB46_26045 [candidate division KSB1 bacterium]|nr:hypothetical protein [candidate division KSB1 bacterium]MDZ7369397.1 hypothetical protein [candidate division KSB1 bacterium]MDZ7407533.1 hypothetical protein [candidate division KSB1 bacterium]